MKKTIIICLLSVLGISLYAQENATLRQTANEVGLPIVCDSMGRAFCKTITIYDSIFGGIEGYAVVDILTKDDAVHIENVKVRSFYERGENRYGSALVEHPHFLGCVQKAIHNKLDHGCIIYPDSGEWSMPQTMHSLGVRVVIRGPALLPNHILLRNDSHTSAP